MEKTFLNWSGGKDSAFALYQLIQSNKYQVEYLYCTLSEQYRRISMHGITEKMLDLQVQHLHIPLRKAYLPESADMKAYEKIMATAVLNFKEKGITTAAFGDIFLEDLRNYREEKLSVLGIKATFPLWQKNTKNLVQDFIALGFKTVVCSINTKFLDESFLGREIDQDFVDTLPANVDPCGENGEFHTFVVDGPIFSKPLQYQLGQRIYKTYPAPKDVSNNCFSSQESQELGFWFIDILPK